MEVRKEHVFFPSGELELEGMVSFPRATSVMPGVVLCHPHPLYGGDMHNNVLVGIEAALLEAGCAVLRFNFRGVNQSEGRYDDGVGEVDDVVAAVCYLAAQNFVNQCQVALVGYSFGAWVGLKSFEKSENIKTVAAIAPPLSVYDFSFLSQMDIPILFVSGEEDHLCPPEALRKACAVIHSIKRVTLPGVDHFLQGYERQVGEVVGSFLCCHL